MGSLPGLLCPPPASEVTSAPKSRPAPRPPSRKTTPRHGKPRPITETTPITAAASCYRWWPGPPGQRWLPPESPRPHEPEASGGAGAAVQCSGVLSASNPTGISIRETPSPSVGSWFGGGRSSWYGPPTAGSQGSKQEWNKLRGQAGGCHAAGPAELPAAHSPRWSLVLGCRNSFPGVCSVPAGPPGSEA